MPIDIGGDGAGTEVLVERTVLSDDGLVRPVVIGGGSDEAALLGSESEGREPLGGGSLRESSCELGAACGTAESVGDDFRSSGVLCTAITSTLDANLTGAPAAGLPRDAKSNSPPGFGFRAESRSFGGRWESAVTVVTLLLMEFGGRARDLASASSAPRHPSQITKA